MMGTFDPVDRTISPNHYFPNDDDPKNLTESKFENSRFLVELASNIIPLYNINPTDRSADNTPLRDSNYVPKYSHFEPGTFNSNTMAQPDITQSPPF